jgi:hypothetical protein
MFGLRKKVAVDPVQDNTVLRQLLKGRDTRWYAGDLLKVNLVIVSNALPLHDDIADDADVPSHYIHE